MHFWSDIPRGINSVSNSACFCQNTLS
eukprot:COSAG02_NODE_8374_length_2594_cov_1.577956_4_plen_26_part_01